MGCLPQKCLGVAHLVTHCISFPGLLEQLLHLALIHRVHAHMGTLRREDSGTITEAEITDSRTVRKVVSSSSSVREGLLRTSVVELRVPVGFMRRTLLRWRSESPITIRREVSVSRSFGDVERSRRNGIYKKTR